MPIPQFFWTLLDTLPGCAIGAIGNEFRINGVMSRHSFFRDSLVFGQLGTFSVRDISVCNQIASVSFCPARELYAKIGFMKFRRSSVLVA
jgi:hypothetical protein